MYKKKHAGRKIFKLWLTLQSPSCEERRRNLTPRGSMYPTFQVSDSRSYAVIVFFATASPPKDSERRRNRWGCSRIRASDL